MLGTYTRVLSKLIAFFLVLLFIIYFVVYGFRYQPQIGLVQQNGYIEMNFWSDQNQVKINGKNYKPEGNELNLYNLKKGCYDIQYQNNKKKICLENKDVANLNLIKSNGKKSINFKDFHDCKNLNFLPHSKRCKGNKCFSNKIQNTFSFKNINFIKLENNDLLHCNKDFKKCSQLSKIKGKIVCGKKQGLIFLNDGSYKLLNLK